MKAVQVMIDEDTLRRLSETDEVREYGRSEVVRRALNQYLRKKEDEAIAARYRAAYKDAETLNQELGEWVAEGEWPET
ncbi:MAG: ribbon-helix-helix protein, CopG family [Spirochaetaceae bacterium]|nr:MAG: ribbon-helix-helix protein, CopG family [Spirochaetaceae bacterium]